MPFGTGGFFLSAIQIALSGNRILYTPIVQTHRTFDCSQMPNFKDFRYETSFDATRGAVLLARSPDGFASSGATTYLALNEPGYDRKQEGRGESTHQYGSDTL